MNTKEFIEKAKKVHGERYDYSKVEYINAHTKVCIVCPIHGEFWQTPNNHTNKTKPKGCPKCAGKLVTDTDSFIKEARKIHGDKYDYSKVRYINAHTKVCIICPIHGEFWQLPTNHLRGKGCQKCKNELLGNLNSSSTNDFIIKAKNVHGDKYDYSKVEYVNNHTQVCIICPIHGEFWQNPNHHLRGHGCRKCRESHLEKDIRLVLEREGINYISSQHFKWLGRQHLDFYLIDYGIGIECQGEQHFIKVNRFNTKKTLEEIIHKDLNKNNLCKSNNIKLFYYTSSLIDSLVEEKPSFYRDNLFTSTDDIIQKIRDTP